MCPPRRWLLSSSAMRSPRRATLSATEFPSKTQGGFGLEWGASGVQARRGPTDRLVIRLPPCDLYVSHAILRPARRPTAIYQATSNTPALPNRPPPPPPPLQ